MKIPRLRIVQFSWLVTLTIILNACSSVSSVREAPPAPTKPSALKGFTPSVSQYHAASFSQLPGWSSDALTNGWPAWMNSCRFLEKSRESMNWSKACVIARGMSNPTNAQIRNYFETHFQVYELRQAQPSGQYPIGSQQGMITGYYEPEIKGSRVRQGVYQTPLHAYPPSWKKQKLEKFPPRKELLNSGELKGLELAWVEDPVAAAFMQIQGSGKILLEDGSVMRLGFAGTNEQPFKSFAQWLIDRKELTRGNASMQSIQQWGRRHPDRVAEMLDANPRYVFFKKLSSLDGPIGSIGVPLVPERSIAVDWKSIPQGAPVYLATTYPNTSTPLERLVFAQDTGVAIVGGVRADFYWGSGDRAAENAGRMKQTGRMWVLLPK